MRRIAFAALAAFVSLFSCMRSMAQVGTSTVVGTVTDPSGAIVAGAKVTLTNEATGVQLHTTATKAGIYTFPSLRPGSYTIDVEAAGFEKWEGKGNVLTVGAPLVVNVHMQIGALTSKVEVQGTYQRVDTANATLSSIIDRNAIQSLPLNGRNPLNLIALQPGLVQRSTDAAGSGTHINGSRDRAFNVTLDGIDINEPSVPNPQSNVYRLNTDNVQEYRIIAQDPTPEFGRNSGANIVMATRSGTNALHGSVHEFNRNTAFNSKDWFVNNTGGFKPVLLLNQYGADLGGPILKDKMFFYGSWEGQRLHQSEPIEDILGAPAVYTSLARTGIFRYVAGCINLVNPAACPEGGTITPDRNNITSDSPQLVNSDGSLKSGVPVCKSSADTNCIQSYNIAGNDPQGIGLDKVMGPFFNSEPAPNFFNSGDGLNVAGFLWNPPSQQPEARWLGRVDYDLNESNHFFARYLISFSDTLLGDFLNGRPEVFPGFPPLGGVRRRPSNLAIGYRHVFSPRMVNEFTTGYGRFLFNFLFGRANPNFPNIPPFVPTGGLTTPFNTAGDQTARWLTTIQFVDNLSYTQGPHLIQTGFNIRVLQHNDQRSFVGAVDNFPNVFFSAATRPPTAAFNLPTNIGSTDEANLEAAINNLLGIPSGLSQAFFASGPSQFTPSGEFIRGARYKQYDMYVQDQWQMRKNLALTYGLRYEFNPPGTEAHNLILRPNLPLSSFGSTGPISFVPRDTLWDRENANALAPRVGVAWDPLGTGRTSVRAGAGIAFDTISTFEMVPILGQGPGSSAACSFTVSDTSGGPVANSSSPNCAVPSGATVRIGQGFPTSLTAPSVPPSTFSTPLVQPLSRAVVGSSVDANLKIPTVYEWDLSLEREIGYKTTVEADYVGKRGTHLYRAYNLNQVKINHDGYIQSFVTARNNLITCGNPNGTSGCGQPVGILSQLFGGTIPTTGGTGKTVATNLLFNAAGGLASFIDNSSTFFGDMVTATGRPDFFRPNPQFSSYFYMDSGGDSYYDALQLQIRRREKDLTYGAAYSFAKSIDDMSVDPVGAVSGGAVGNNSRTPTDIYNFRVDRGRSDFDRRHDLSAFAVWNVPVGRGQRWGANVPRYLNQLIGGWNVSTIMMYMTGEPWSVLSGRLTNGNVRFSRADIVGRLPSSGSLFFNIPNVTGPQVFNFTPGTYVSSPASSPNLGCLPLANGSLLCTPPPGSDGGLGRNIFSGPSFWNEDISLSKAFSLTERFQLQFRSDFFNAFNHPNFDNPLNSTNGSTSITSGAFAQTCCSQVALSSSTSVQALGEPYRVIQFGLRLFW